ncbi:MAG: hypothetical protein ACI4TX_04580 [Christensenellales bacterium]
MRNARILTRIAGIIDAVLGIAMCATAVFFIIAGTKPVPEDAGIGAIGVAIAMAVLIALGIIFAILGIVLVIYGIIFIVLSKNNVGNINKKRKAILVLSILQIIVAVLCLVASIFNVELRAVLIVLGVVLMVSAILKLIDCKKMRTENKLRKPTQIVSENIATLENGSN